MERRVHGDSQTEAVTSGARMWKTICLLFFSATMVSAEEAVDQFLTDEAIKLLQVDNIQNLEKNLLDVKALKSEREQEVEALKAGLESTKGAHAAQMTELKSSHAEELEKQRSTLQGKADKSWTLVGFMMKVLKKSNGAAKAREKLMGTQAAMLGQLKAELAECKENIGESLKMVRDSQEVIQGQRETIEDLESVVVEESSLNAAYQKIRDADCDLPRYLASITTTLSTQQEEIQNLKKAVSRGYTVVDLLAGINNATNRGAEIVTAVHGNWGILEECQGVLEKQSSSLDLLRTLASERVTRDNSLRFKQNGEGQIIAADFCQCIPEPPKLSSPNLAVSLSLAKVDDVWLATTMWSAWEYKNCERKTMGYGATIDYGYGSKTRRRLKALDEGIWEEDVEEVSCPRPPAQCFNYKELNSPTRKSTYTSQSPSYCDKSSHSHIHSDWKGAGWYRITGQAGTQLAGTQVPSRKFCGTHATGSLIGGHPSVQQGEVNRAVHFNLDSYPAWQTTTIKVINCGSYYVYHLSELSICSSSYCTI